MLSAVWCGLFPIVVSSGYRPLFLAPQAMSSGLLAIALHTLGGTAWTVVLLLNLLLGFAALLVALLDYLLGDTLAAEAERKSSGQRHRPEQDQERRRYELWSDAQLGQGHEDRKDDDAVLRDVGRDARTRGPLYYPGDEIGEQGGENQYQDRRDHLRYVGDELRQNVGYGGDTQCVHGHRYGYKEHEPEDQLAEYG